MEPDKKFQLNLISKKKKKKIHNAKSEQRGVKGFKSFNDHNFFNNFFVVVDCD